jgi:hypothetical protein
MLGFSNSGAAISTGHEGYKAEDLGRRPRTTLEEITPTVDAY